MLPAGLLALLRERWKFGRQEDVMHPDGWLFPGHHYLKPLSTRQLHLVVVETGISAGIDKRMGRIDGARIAVADPLNCKGAYSDAGGGDYDELEFMVLDQPSQVRAFKVPSLRGVGQRAPYGHRALLWMIHSQTKAGSLARGRPPGQE